MINRASLRAKIRGVPLVVGTFYPHPMAITSPELKPKLLMTLEQRLEILASLGVDITWVIPFRYDVARLNPLEFLSELHQTLSPVELYVGCGFRFGNERCGNLDNFKFWSMDVGCELHNHILESYEGDSISSTRIRLALEAGKIELANILLGRPYSLTGKITTVKHAIGLNNCHSFQLNLSCEQESLLRYGNYITEVSGFFMSEKLLGITRINRGNNFLVAINTLAFGPNICGYSVELRFLHCLI
jgi:riboflavin kinase/FMN adenylyltransferase